jgi:hypothetical protein
MGGFGRYRGGEEESEADAEHKIPRAKNTELLIFFSLLTSHFSLLTFTPFTVRKINFGGMPEPKITLDRNYKIQLRTHSWKINRMFLKKYSLK